MKYIEERYTQPNEDGVIGLVFIPTEEPTEEMTEKPAEPAQQDAQPHAAPKKKAGKA